MHLVLPVVSPFLEREVTYNIGDVVAHVEGLVPASSVSRACAAFHILGAAFCELLVRQFVEAGGRTISGFRSMVSDIPWEIPIVHEL